MRELAAGAQVTDVAPGEFGADFPLGDEEQIQVSKAVSAAPVGPMR
jgi:hypothetical protein